MATGIPGEGPWLRLNPETGTAPEKGLPRTLRAGANTSLPGNTRRKSAAYGASSVFWYFLARQKRANGFLGAKQNRNVQGTKGKFPAQRGCPPGISETSAPELVLALRKRAVRLPIPTSAVGTGLPAVASAFRLPPNTRQAAPSTGKILIYRHLQKTNSEFRALPSLHQKSNIINLPFFSLPS